MLGKMAGSALRLIVPASKKGGLPLVYSVYSTRKGRAPLRNSLSRDYIHDPHIMKKNGGADGI
jgi:hypothetical protein